MKQGIYLLVFINLILLGVIGFFSINKQYKPKKIAYIEVAVLLSKYEGMKAVRLEFEEKTNVWQANIDTLQNNLLNELKKYEKERNSLSARERELTEQLIQKKQDDVIKYRDAVQNKAADEDKKLTEVVLNQVNSFITQYGKDNEYDIIFGTGNSNVLHAKEYLNITEEVLLGINQQYNPK